MQILTYLLIGLIVGSISGVLGIGGGVLLVPALMWLLDYKWEKATGTSLAILIPPIGLPTAWRAYNENQVNLEAALWIAGAFTIGAYFSRGLLDYISPHWFRLIFGTVMIFIALRFIIGADADATSAAAGLAAAILAWLTYWGLKVLGRRYPAPPKLGEQIQQEHEKYASDRDYQI